MDNYKDSKKINKEIKMFKNSLSYFNEGLSSYEDNPSFPGVARLWLYTTNQYFDKGERFGFAGNMKDAIKKMTKVKYGWIFDRESRTKYDPKGKKI